MKQSTIVILTALVALATFTTAIVLYQSHDRQQAAGQAAEHSDVMVRTHSPIMGLATAPVTIAEFIDPACESCRAFYPHVKQILATYPNDVRLVIRYVPFHGEPSIAGVQILEAACQQQLFEPVLAALMQSQPVWASHSNPAPARAWEFAAAAGLDLEQARAYVATGAVDKVLEQDVADLKALGVRSTPTFFVSGKPLQEVDPRALLEMVKSEVERVRKTP